MFGRRKRCAESKNVTLQGFAGREQLPTEAIGEKVFPSLVSKRLDRLRTSFGNSGREESRGDDR
jgi:hypothetical protein